MHSPQSKYKAKVAEYENNDSLSMTHFKWANAVPVGFWAGLMIDKLYNHDNVRAIRVSNETTKMEQQKWNKHFKHDPGKYRDDLWPGVLPVRQIRKFWCHGRKRLVSRLARSLASFGATDCWNDHIARLSPSQLPDLVLIFFEFFLILTHLSNQFPQRRTPNPDMRPPCAHIAHESNLPREPTGPNSTE